MNGSNGSDWYALKVRTRSEEDIGKALQQKEYEVFVPLYLEARQYTDRVKKVWVALFPGYLFARLDPALCITALKTPGVEYVVGGHEEPTPVDAAEIAALRQIVDSGAQTRPWAYLKTGSKVRVEFGSFAGVEGIYTAEKGKDRLVVSITLLQRSVAVEIDRTWIKPL